MKLSKALSLLIVVAIVGAAVLTAVHRKVSGFAFSLTSCTKLICLQKGR